MISIKFPLPLIEIVPSLWTWVVFIFRISQAVFMQRTTIHENVPSEVEAPEELHRKPAIVTHFTSADGVCPFCPIDQCGHTGTSDLVSPNLISSGSEISNSVQEAHSNTSVTPMLQTKSNRTDPENVNTSVTSSAIPHDESTHVPLMLQPGVQSVCEPLTEGSIRYSSNHLKTVHFPLHPPKFRKQLQKLDSSNKENSTTQRHFITSPYKRVKWSSSSSSKSDHCQKGNESDSSTSSSNFSTTVTSSSAFIRQQLSSSTPSSRGLKRKRSQAHLKSRIPLKILNTTAATALSSRSRIR